MFYRRDYGGLTRSAASEHRFEIDLGLNNRCPCLFLVYDERSHFEPLKWASLAYRRLAFETEGLTIADLSLPECVGVLS